MRKSLISTLVITLSFSGLINLATTTAANSATCTSKELASMQKIDGAMLEFALLGEQGPVFTAIDKARKATKSKALKTLYSKLEAAVEEGGYSKYGEANKLWTSLQSKMKFKRC